MQLDESVFVEGERVTFFVFVTKGNEPIPVHDAKVNKVDLSVPRLQVRAPTDPSRRKQWNFNRLRNSTPVIVTSSYITSSPPEDVRYFKCELLSKMGRTVTLRPYEEAIPSSKRQTEPDYDVSDEPVIDPVEPDTDEGPITEVEEDE